MREFGGLDPVPCFCRSEIHGHFFHAVWCRGYFGDTATGSGGAAHMVLPLCTHVLVADLWDDPRLFFWYGDILVTYSLCGFVVYWFSNLSARALFLIGCISLLVALLIMMSAGVAPLDVQQGILENFVLNPADIDREIAAYRGT